MPTHNHSQAKRKPYPKNPAPRVKLTSLYDWLVWRYEISKQSRPGARELRSALKAIRRANLRLAIASLQERPKDRLEELHSERNVALREFWDSVPEVVSGLKRAAEIFATQATVDYIDPLTRDIYTDRGTVRVTITDPTNVFDIEPTQRSSAYLNFTSLS